MIKMFKSPYLHQPGVIYDLTLLQSEYAKKFLVDLWEYWLFKSSKRPDHNLAYLCGCGRNKLLKRIVLTTFDAKEHAWDKSYLTIPLPRKSHQAEGTRTAWSMILCGLSSRAILFSNPRQSRL